MAEGVEERPSKRRPPCNRADRASATRRYPTRKGADFRHGLNGRDALVLSVYGMTPDATLVLKGDRK